MIKTTVADFANVLRVTADDLIAQLCAAGVAVSGPDDPIDEDDKHALLAFLRLKHGKNTDGTRNASDRDFARGDDLDALWMFWERLLFANCSGELPSGRYAETLAVSAEWLVTRLRQAGVDINGPDDLIGKEELEALLRWLRQRLDEADDSEWPESETLWTAVRDGYDVRQEQSDDRRDLAQLWRDNNEGRDPNRK